MKNYRPEQERKLKRPVHRLWQRRQPPEEPSRRRLPKLSEQSPQLFNQQSVRVAVFTIHLRLQWQRAQCVRRAAKSVGNLYAGFWEEFSVAARGDGSCSHGPVGRLRTSHSDLAKKNRRTIYAPGDLKLAAFIASVKQPDWRLLSLLPCRPSLPRR